MPLLAKNPDKNCSIRAVWPKRVWLWVGAWGCPVQSPFCNLIRRRHSEDGCHCIPGVLEEMNEKMVLGGEGR